MTSIASGCNEYHIFILGVPVRLPLLSFQVKGGDIPDMAGSEESLARGDGNGEVIVGRSAVDIAVVVQVQVQGGV